MTSLKRMTNIGGWIVFAIALIVYYFSAERSGSLWDCGEFILGAFKLQVVHPPGAPLFLLIGRMFTIVADVVSDNPSDIAFSVNLLSCVCTAAMAMFVCWTTAIFARITTVGRKETPDKGQSIVIVGAGVVAGLAAAFCSSIWFSAVEGEVYAMSTFFTALTFWSVVKWYSLPNDGESDRWMVFAIFAATLSTGVHLLSILTFPAIALFFYFKKWKTRTWLGIALAGLAGVGMLVFIQIFIILGIPNLWASFELMMVNGFGAPVHSGLWPLLILLFGTVGGGIWYAGKKNNALLQKLFVALAMTVIAYSTVGVVLIRANIDTPVNMNRPSDPLRLLPYLNREQYGDRPILKGPNFDKETHIF